MERGRKRGKKARDGAWEGGEGRGSGRGGDKKGWGEAGAREEVGPTRTSAGLVWGEREGTKGPGDDHLRER